MMIWVSLCCVIIPLILHLKYKIFSNTKFTLVILSCLFSTVILSGLTLLLMNGGVVQQVGFTKDNYLTAILLYFFSLYFLATSIYLFFNERSYSLKAEKHSFTLSNLLLGLSIAVMFFFYKRSFSLTSFVSLFVVLIYVEYRSNLRYMFKVYRVFALFIPLLLIFNWVLIYNNQFVQFKQQSITEISIFKTPIEVLVIIFTGFLIGVNFIERLKIKKK